MGVLQRPNRDRQRLDARRWRSGRWRLEPARTSAPASLPASSTLTLLLLRVRHVTRRRSNQKKRAFKRTYEASRIDPKGYAAKANRRNNAETGNHAFKAILGDQIYSRDPIAQRNEILCMCIAYNLTRLVYLEVERGVEVGFEGGVQVLSRLSWVPLERLHAQFKGTSVPRPEWRSPS